MGQRSPGQNKAALIMAFSVALGLGVVTPAGEMAWSETERALEKTERPVEVIEALQACRQENDAGKRLRCYDDVAAKNAPPNYAGKLGYTTAPFSLDRPHVLRFRSQGVIFVLYLIDEDGQVVQNLHIGGGGEDTYLIEKPGTYSLQIDGSSRWQIWLDPA